MPGTVVETGDSKLNKSQFLSLKTIKQKNQPIIYKTYQCILKKLNVIQIQVELFGLKDSHSILFGENALILMEPVGKINSLD